MNIIKTSKYIRDYKNKLIKKHMIKEIETIDNITNLIIASSNMQMLILSPYAKVYNINQKHGNLKHIFTANINDKLRLWMKPNKEYPYNLIEIKEIEFLNIDDKHYGEG